MDELAWRGAVNQATDEAELKKITTERKISLYEGVDPTGPSLHIGHLVSLMILKRFQQFGHQPYIVIGGGTGSIGDPSGRSAERVLQSMETIEANAESLKHQLERFFGKDGFVFVNNYDWLSKIDLLEFLRDYAKQFSINTMIAKDSVQNRLANGISFTEFSYPILQAIDFLNLRRDHHVELQIGGGDQWGNLTAGVDFIHRQMGSSTTAFALTCPLIVRADGTKFGKTADGQSVWVDPEKTSPYEFYQFWYNQPDEVVVNYLKFFTFLDQDEIKYLEQQVIDQPEKRSAQKALAEAVTTFVHGEDSTKQAERISVALFSGEYGDLSADEIKQALAEMPHVEVANEKAKIVEWLVDLTKIEPSRRQAREDLKNGAIAINGEKVTDEEFVIDPAAKYEGKYVVVKIGKKRYYLAHVK
ncbi:tyrosine--tRNA ligase [Xylocopilactobacillus apicola]|nr:tyrosine--tRNA ligase [Xylocopilactobacillus apicola]